MAELKIALQPQILSCTGLGSCVAVALYEPKKKIGGIAHVMLPRCRNIQKHTNKAKFADTAIELMLEQMIAKGADKKKIYAKIFGGANMFPSLNTSPSIQVGAANILAVSNELKKWSITLVAQDVGGNYGRSIFFSIETGDILVKTLRGLSARVF